MLRKTCALMMVAGNFAFAQGANILAQQLVTSATRQIGVTVRYDPEYQAIAFPEGDVPMDRGVCTDVLIRAYRSIGVDLQSLVNRDMRGNFRAYPHQWGLRQPDTNIDHRRVPNLAVYFTRHGRKLAASQMPGCTVRAI